MNEAVYWLELMAATDYLKPKESDSLQTDAVKILKLLTTTTKTPKNSLEINH